MTYECRHNGMVAAIVLKKKYRMSIIVNKISWWILIVLVPFIVKAQQMPAIPPNQLSLPPGNHEINFTWGTDSINGQPDPYASLLIPVKLLNCPKKFYMQFDLGSPYSLFYADKLKAIAGKYRKSIQLADTSSKIFNTSFTAGNMKLTAKEIVVRQHGSLSIDWNDQSIEIIGTLGADLIENKVLVLDYPKRCLIIGDSIPQNLAAHLSLSSFMFAGRNTLLPAVIKGKKTFLYFDTGSSTFGLITDKPTFLSLANKDAILSSYPVKSWDRVMTANTAATSEHIEMASQQIPLQNVTWFEGASEAQVDRMMKMGMGGMIGNRIFLNSILVLDTKQLKFGIMLQAPNTDDTD